MIITFGIASKQVSKHVLRIGCSSSKVRITLQYPNRKSEDRNKRIGPKTFQKDRNMKIGCSLDSSTSLQNYHAIAIYRRLFLFRFWSLFLPSKKLPRVYLYSPSLEL